MNEIKRIVVQSSRMGNLVIKRISKEKAKGLIIKNHYSKKLGANHGLFNYGIFQENKEAENECLGVAVYGYMMHPKARHFTHPNPQALMLELNRMWISDELGKNAETILIKRFRYNKPSQPYPAYNRGVTPFEWQRNRKLIKERLIKFISELE